MKKIISLILSLIILGTFSACSLNRDSKTNLVQIKSKGSVVENIIENFDKSYYSISELNSVISEEIVEYNSKQGKDNVKLLKCEEKDSKVNVKIEYASVTDYNAFNKIDFFAGTVSEAIEKGYDFNTIFTEVETDGKIDSNDIKQLSDYHVVITDEALNVELSGKVLYLSGNTTIVSKKIASISQKEGEKAITYLIYK